MKETLRFSAYVLLFSVLVGCGGDLSNTMPLPQNAAGECVPDPDPIDPECNVCLPPAQPPEFDGDLVVQGAQPLPASSGGDLAGEWLISGVTVYLPEVVTSLADLDQSGFSGSGWFVVEPEGAFRFAFGGVATVKLSSSDTPLELGAGAGGKGHYIIGGTTIDFDPECQFIDNQTGIEVDPDSATVRLAGNPFSVLGADIAQLQLQVTVQGFAVDIVADLERAN